jgi:hypothetical protein
VYVTYAIATHLVHEGGLADFLILVRLGDSAGLVTDVLRLGMRLVRGTLADLLRAVAALGHGVRAALDGDIAVNDLGVCADHAARVAHGVAELRSFG